MRPIPPALRGVGAALVALPLLSAHALAQKILVPDDAGDVLLTSAGLLADDLGMTVQLYDPGSPVTPGPGSIVVSIATLPGLDEQGFHLKIDNTPPIQGNPRVVVGKDEEGAVNGIHDLRRRLRLNGMDVSALDLDLPVNPSYLRRGVLVNYGRYGGQQGRLGIASDDFTYAEWKEYVDFLRLMNVNRLVVALHGMYDRGPTSAIDATTDELLHERHRYEILREVMHDCQDLGIEFVLGVAAGMVPDDFFWDNPELHVEEGHPDLLDEQLPDHKHESPWFGQAVSLPKVQAAGLDTTLAGVQAATYEWFQDAAGFLTGFSEGAADYGNKTVTMPLVALNDALTFVEDQILDPDPTILYYGWLHDIWFRIQLGDPDYVEHPAFQGWQTDSLDEIATYSDEWVQESGRNYAKLAELLPGVGAALTGNDPASADPLTEIPLADFDRTVFWYWTNPEFVTSMLPRPIIAETIEEVNYTAWEDAGRGNPRATGFLSYRFTPTTRRINDYVTFRLAADDGFHAVYDSTAPGEGPAGVRDLLLQEAAQYLVGDSQPSAVVDDVRDVISMVDVARPVFAGTGELNFEVVDVEELRCAAAMIGPLDLSSYPAAEELKWLVVFTTAVYSLAVHQDQALAGLPPTTCPDPTPDCGLSCSRDYWLGAARLAAESCEALRAFSQQNAWAPDNVYLYDEIARRLRLAYY